MGRDWVAPKCKYRFTTDDMNNTIIETDGSYHAKITGTAMGGLLDCSPWSSKFAATTKLLGLWDEDIGDKPAVNLGRVLEERIIDYATIKHSDVGTFIKAKELYEERKGAHDSWSSDFEDDVFAGHVDGIVSKDGKDYILEVKTARDVSAWLEGPPEHYFWQVALYNHFITKQDKAYFLLGVVDTKDYANPNGWVPNKDNCFLFEVEIDQDAVQSVIWMLRNEYAETVAAGKSTVPTDNPLDMEILTHLKDISGTSEELADLVERYGKVKAENKRYIEDRKANFEEEDRLKDRIKDVMTSWSIAKCGKASIRMSERTSFDFKKAEADGFTVPEQYIKTTKTTTLTYKE